MKAQDCATQIQANWSTDLDITTNIDHCRLGLINWDRVTFGNVKQQVRLLESEISSLQQQTLTPSVRQSIKDKRLELESLLDKEECMWKQRSKVQWLAEGDRNTRFFHSQATRRAKRNAILGLRDQNGVWCENPQEMGSIINQFYAVIFTSQEPART